MKRKNRVKLMLDIVMLLVLLLMYNKNVLGLTFHELGGIAVCGLFIIHILLNGKWVLVISGKLFSKKIAWRCKLNWLIDFLLLLCFAYILISGIFISMVLFDGQQSSTMFKMGHYSVSALALVLLGIHLGLHYATILKRTSLHKLPPLFRRVAAVVLSVSILGFGVYQMTETSFLLWLSNVTATISGTTAVPEGAPGAFPEGMTLPEGRALPEGMDVPEGRAYPTDETGALVVPEGEEGFTRGNGLDGGFEGQDIGIGRIGETGVNITVLWDVLLSFLSITLVFCVVTAWIDGAQLTCKRNKRLKRTLPA